MAIQNKDYFTFLGGEVSPNLFKRVDMRAANKWFETAKNIFFDTTGGFFNRVGSEIVDNSYPSGYKLKLLKFIYNKSQTYEVIFSQNEIKIFNKNNVLLQTITYNINIPDNFDIVYTQIGDVMYICFDNTTKMYTLKRYAEDNWVFEQFDYSIPPMLEMNSDINKTLTFSVNNTYTQRKLYYKSISGTTLKTNSNSAITVSLKYTDNTTTTIYTYTTTQLNSFDDFCSDFNSNKSTSVDITAYTANNNLYFSIKSSDATTISNVIFDVQNCEYNILNYSATGEYPTHPEGVTIDGQYFQPDFRNTQTINLNNCIIYSMSYYGIFAYWTEPNILSSSLTEPVYSSWETPQNVATSLATLYPPRTGFTNPVSYDSTTKDLTVNVSYKTTVGDDFKYVYGIRINKMKYAQMRLNQTYTLPLGATQSSNNCYNVVSNANFFSNKKIGDFFAVESVFSPSVEGTAGINKTVSVTAMSGMSSGYLPATSPEGQGFWSNGTWRLVTSGIWSGYYELQYSYDGETWYSHRSFTSSIRTENNISYSNNYNEYGTLDVNDTVKLRLKYSIGSTPINAAVTFDTDSFENRSYYKILSITDDNTAIVQCVKYSVGTPETTYKYAESAWSDVEGYPSVCFTYQNRLCFAKTTGNPFTTWTSRTNDYADFSTKIKYQDDDPITMDVIKFNGISNITTVAALNKLFIFTEDSEFGIQDQGALTQANKSLISFSKYGAEPIETQVSGNRILFVENGGKAARQLFYDFAQENYEAPDVTVLYKHLLKGNEKIIATDYIGLDYRTYLMLTNTGRVICYKYIPEQEITACSWFKHAKGTITNISALNIIDDSGNNNVKIFIAVDIGSRKQIETIDLSNESYLDSRHTFTTVSETDTIDVSSYYDNDDVLIYFFEGIKYTATVTNGNVTLEKQVPSGTSITFGYAYEAEATLIPMNVLSRNGSTAYNKKNLFKANFEYADSVGFKIGIKDYQDEFEEIQYLDGPIDYENTPHSGQKNDIPISSSYLGKNMLSFKQAEPYKMNITNLQVEVDYGG